MHLHKPSASTRETRAPSGFPQPVGAMLRFVQEQIGGEVIVGLAITNVVLWLLLRPPGVPRAMYLGEIFGTTAILLFSCALVLTTRSYIRHNTTFPWEGRERRVPEIGAKEVRHAEKALAVHRRAGLKPSGGDIDSPPIDRSEETP